MIIYTNDISVEDYNMLRASAGWLTIHPEQAKVGLKGSALLVTAMMTQIMDYLKSKLKPCYGIQIDLMSAKGKETFYEKFGFSVRPRENRGAGMDMWIIG